MILMVPNKHKESVALCIYQFPGVIGFWNCWFSRKGKWVWVKKKNLLKKGREPTTESTQTSHCLCDSKYEAILVGVSASTTTLLLLVPHGIHVSKYPVYDKVLNNK